MRILVIHRVPFQYIKYDVFLDHEQHDVVYVGTASSLETIPVGLRCTKIERPESRGLAEEVLELVAQALPFDRVVSLSQFDVLEAGAIRDALGVPGTTRAQALQRDDKLEMKRRVSAAGLPAPRFLSCAAALAGQPANWNGRTVLKPIAGTASKDVHVFRSFEAAVEAAAKNSMGIVDFDPLEFEIEEFVEGPVLMYDGIMLDGEPIAAIASRYLGTCLAFAHGEPLGSVQLPERLDLCELGAKFVRAVGIANGPFHLEMIESAQGPVFLEVAARSGGGPIVEIFEQTFGIDLIRAEVFIELDRSALANNSARAEAHTASAWPS